MARAKKTSKHKHLRKALPLLEIAGLSLSLAGGALASTGASPGQAPPHNGRPDHNVFLSEEEMHDASLATFYIFDRENPAKFELAQQQGEPSASPSPQQPQSQEPQSQQAQPVPRRGKRGKITGCRGCGGCAGCAGCAASPSETSKGPAIGACCSSWGSCRDC
jgi:hypothetical protein